MFDISILVCLCSNNMDFQEGVAPPIFLLTSLVGGLGRTLTKADRLTVVDPAWNPRLKWVLLPYSFTLLRFL